MDYLDEAEAAAAAELRSRERHCLVDMCEDEAAQHEKLRGVQAEFAELEIQRGAQTRVGERLDTRHLDMLYWKVLHQYSAWNGLQPAGISKPQTSRASASARPRTTSSTSVRSGVSVRSVRSVQSARNAQERRGSPGSATWE